MLVAQKHEYNMPLRHVLEVNRHNKDIQALAGLDLP